MDQLIYTSIEQDISPTHREGYQTVVSTRPALSASEVTEIEGRLFYPLELKATEPKFLFFALESSRMVIVRIIPTADVDKFGRAGKFLAHAVICSDDEFTSVANNPFHIIRGFAFAESIDDISARTDISSGHIDEVPVPPLKLPEESSSSNSIAGQRDSEFSAELMGSFLELAAGTADSSPTSPNVIFNGQSEKVCVALEQIFTFLPISLRRLCSFDTMTTTRTLRRWPYWALGLSQGNPGSTALALHDLETGEFQYPSDRPPAAPFLVWLEHHFQKDAPLPDPYDINGAYILSRLLTGHDCTEMEIDSVTDETFAWFKTANGREFGDRILEILKRQVGACVARYISASATAWFLTQGVPALEYFSKGFSPESVTNWLAEAVYKNTNPPTIQDLNELIAYHSANHDDCIHLYLLRWQNQWDALTKAMSNLDEEYILKYISWAVQTLDFMPPCQIMTTTTGRFLKVALSGDQQHDEHARNVFGVFFGPAEDNVDLGESHDEEESPDGDRGIKRYFKRMGGKNRDKQFLVWTLRDDIGKERATRLCECTTPPTDQLKHRGDEK